MTAAEVKQKTCNNCGAEVRENTMFCYNCGSGVGEAPVVEPEVETNGVATEADSETQAALADLAGRFKIEEVEDDGKLAKAASERRKARIKHRKPAEFVWEPAEDSANRVVVLLAILVAVIAAAAVFLTVFQR